MGRFKFGALLLFSMALPALHATTLDWTIHNAQFEDGGTLTGSFGFDADDLSYQQFGYIGFIESGNFVTTPGSWGSGTSYAGIENLAGSEGYGLIDDNTWDLCVDIAPGSNNYSLCLALASKPADAGGTIAIVDGYERLDYASGPQQDYFRDLLPGATFTASAAAEVVPEPGTILPAISGFALIALGCLRKRSRLCAFL